MEQQAGAERQKAGRTALAAAIERHRAQIVERWLERVRADIGSSQQGVTQTDLRDGIDDYLINLASSLRSDSPSREGTAAWKRVARAHEVTRVRLGFDISQLVHEFIALRETMSAVLREGVPMESSQVDDLATLVDLAIAAAVASYVESRDYATRAQQAQHIGFVTHELRNPLTTAKMAATQLRRTGGLPAPAGRLLDAMDRGHERMRQLIDDVLLSERLRGGQLRCEPVDVPLGRLMEEALRVAGHHAREKGLDLQARYDPGVVLHVDPALAVSALQNVVDNAVKFTDQGDVLVTVEDRAGEVAIHVDDACSGLSEEELATIFEPFRRGHSGKPGTGLGLAIARRAVMVHGGTITAESSQDVGCRFTLTLPRSRH